MRFVKKVVAMVCPNMHIPKDEPEVPTSLRNPYGSKLLDRLAMQYQTVPFENPNEPVEKAPGFTPETLKSLEKSQMMPEGDKVALIKQRDLRWYDGRN